jgi:DNA-binding response OmpR family regulator
MAKKILIVDDDKEDLKTIKTVLTAEGYEVFAANDGAKALDSLSENKPDLILIDIKMPTLSGYDLLRLLREKLNHKVKMIYVSIVPEQEVDMGDIDGFVQKPFDPKNLSNEVKNVLGGK